MKLKNTWKTKLKIQYLGASKSIGNKTKKARKVVAKPFKASAKRIYDFYNKASLKVAKKTHKAKKAVSENVKYAFNVSKHTVTLGNKYSKRVLKQGKSYATLGHLASTKFQRQISELKHEYRLKIKENPSESDSLSKELELKIQDIKKHEAEAKVEFKNKVELAKQDHVKKLEDLKNKKLSRNKLMKSKYELNLQHEAKIENLKFQILGFKSDKHVFDDEQESRIKSDRKTPIAQIDDLVLSYLNPATHKKKLVIRETSLKVYKGEVLAIIGESGSGKSVITSTLLGLQGNNAIFESGSVKVKGVETSPFDQKTWEESGLRGVYISTVFQNPMTTLNPTMKVGKQIAESFLIHNRARDKDEAKRMTINLLRRVKIANPEAAFDRYPHELSGGMKQRVVISAIIAAKPELIIFDEPTTALDPTVQAEILSIIKQLVVEENIGAVFITHDLGVVAMIANRIAIMYAGKIVEQGTTEEILFHPQHPYTWGLLGSMPDVNTAKRLNIIKGSVPQDLSKIVGDAFAPRNSYAINWDNEAHPPFFQVSPTHFAATWLLHPEAPKYRPPKVIYDRWNDYLEKRPELKTFEVKQIEKINDYI